MLTLDDTLSLPFVLYFYIKTCIPGWLTIGHSAFDCNVSSSIGSVPGHQCQRPAWCVGQLFVMNLGLIRIAQTLMYGSFLSTVAEIFYEYFLSRRLSIMSVH
jgi:hypothetical protein